MVCDVIPPERGLALPPGQPVEVTHRTFQGRYLLLPKREVRPIVMGALGRAQRRLEMPIHAFTFASHSAGLVLIHEEGYAARLPSPNPQLLVIPRTTSISCSHPETPSTEVPSEGV